MSFLKDFKELKKDISGAVIGSEGTGMNQDTSNPQDTAGVDEALLKEQGRQTGGEKKGMSDMTKETANQADSDVTVIAAGAVVKGNLESTGSLAVYGVVEGDIRCGKKLIAGGRVAGNINAAEIFINKASVDGNVVSEGNLKIGSGSVVMGDVFGQTAVIAGAVKGEIDIKGPVIIDNTAVIRGNIRSRSVQINNGAVIEGYCTQCYHDVDVNDIFKDTFHEEEKNEEPVFPVSEAQEQDSEPQVSQEISSVTDQPVTGEQNTAAVGTEDSSL